MGLGAVAYLRTLYPKANIIYAVPQWGAPLYAEVKTEASSIYPLKLKVASDYVKTFFELRKMKIDHIHEMHQTGTGSKFFSFLAFTLGIRYTAHNHHLKSETGVIDQGLIKPLIQRDLDGVFSFLGRDERPNFLQFKPEIKIEQSVHKPRIIFGVVATRQTKMWPLENFVNLAQLILKTKPQTEIVIPLSRSLQDVAIKKNLIELGLPKEVQFLELGLRELPKYFGESSFYFGNDTGLKHIAVAVNLNSYTLFGPEPASEWHPYETLNHQFFYEENLACRVRTHHYCGLDLCDLDQSINMQCLKKMTAKKALEIISPYI